MEMPAQKIAVILGTRPEIIKMCPVIRELQRLSIGYFVLHTGQHYSYNMDRVFFEQLRLPAPSININVGSGSHAEETGKMMIGIEGVLRREMPTAVLVQGDTNTVLAGALTATKMRIKVGHVEAGLRSGDMSMPEEVNRIVADHVSDYLFAPTETAKANLLREGLAGTSIHVTGNTVVDAAMQNLTLSRGIDTAGIVGSGKFFLVTMHRQENVDDRRRLSMAMGALQSLAEKFGRVVVYPMHPRTRKRLGEFGLTPGSMVKVIEPVDYLTFLKLEIEADLILTDSGGLQEEACILKVPCVTLRENTERPETVAAGANMLAGTDPARILAAAGEMLGRKRSWENPYGDGRAAERIVRAVLH
jgi:UDP-N-acetylglucosamine 2-epimerase (non-hydrolysing)